MIEPDPIELERQHLTDLLEAVERCAFFCDHLVSSIPFPLTANLLESRCRDLDLFDKLAAFTLLSGYKSNNSIWLKFPVSDFLKSFFISSSCKEIFSNG